MNRKELESMWANMLRAERLTEAQLDSLAAAVVEIHQSGTSGFRQHIKNRLEQIAERTGSTIVPENFDPAAARTFIADELGFASWDELLNAIQNPGEKPLLFKYAVAAMERGDFSALETMVGGSEKFDDQVIDWYEKGYFENELETLAEIFSAACMLGHTRAVEYLLDNGVDPYAGMKTGLGGSHYAASSGRLNVIKLLMDRGVPMEVKDMYGGTVFDQAIWSAVNEYTPQHGEIVERLVEAGAVVDDGYHEWWAEQNVPDAGTKERVANVLRRSR